MKSVICDFETRSTVELKTAGVYRYAQDSSTDVWCMAYAFDDEEPKLWKMGESFPMELTEHIFAGGAMHAHNAQFERLIWKYVMEPQGWPAVRMDRWYCTAAQAAAMGLPRSLAGVGDALNLSVKKDPEGEGIVQRVCRPRKIEADGTIIWWGGERLERLYAYCLQDVRAERAVQKATRPLNEMERRVYLLNQRVNDRGFYIDLPLVKALMQLTGTALERANAELRSLTDGAVPEVTKLARMKAWIAGQGLEVGSMDKDAVKDILARDDLSDIVRAVVEIRAEAGLSSISKLETMVEMAQEDSIVRGTTLYHGASTGRESGKGVQPHNYPRGAMKFKDVEAMIPAVMAGEFDAVDQFVPPIELASAMLRPCITARPGHSLYVGDFAGIEARITSWVAGQHDELALFAAGVDVYMDAAKRLAKAKGMPLPEDADKNSHPHERQGAKAQILGCGFQMGWKTFVKQAKKMFGLELTEEQAKEAVKFYRDTHPKVVEYWKDMNQAAIDAVMQPGAVFYVGDEVRVALTKRGPYLWLVLPSKRMLCYAQPKIVQRKVPWSNPNYEAETRPAVECYGAHPITKQWVPYTLYGGILTENVVQAIARDIMVLAEERVEDAGYPVVLCVHDEVIADVSDDFSEKEDPFGGSLKEYLKLLEVRPDWAKTCPIAAEGWRGKRYRK